MLLKPLTVAGLVLGVSLLPAFAQDRIKGFTSDPLEVFDEDENFIEEYDLETLNLDDIKVVESTKDMLLIHYDDGRELGWVFKTDVQSEAGCREAGTAKAHRSTDRSSMGLDGDLCE